MQGKFFLGTAVGACAVLFGPMLWKSGRPAIKGAVRAGIEGYGIARIRAAQFAEEVEDLVAEVVHEMQEAVVEAPPAAEPMMKGKKKGNG